MASAGEGNLPMEQQRAFMVEMRKGIRESISKLEKWVENHNYKGYEPFDGLSSVLRPLSFNNLFAERILQQLVRQSPINIRPLLGIKPQESTKGRGYMAWGYLALFRLTGDEHYKEKAVLCLEWLIKHKSPRYVHYCWGNHFDYSSRGGRYSKFEPITVWTSLIGQTFLDAYETLGDDRYLEIATSICDWILELPREKTDSGLCLSYLAFTQSSIHNANMLGAAMLTRTAHHTRSRALLELAKEAMEYSCSRQLPDGAWYYGEASNNHWIDNFHSGYNLESLKCYIENSADKTYEENLHRGFGYFKRTFFEENGRPKYYHNRAYPIDIQCASQAIETLADFSTVDTSSLELSLRVAKWTIDHMQDEKGFFYYRILPRIKVKTPMLHWGQATMYRALTLLLSRVGI
jgi:rhamnogalacturonyl hydrolase YesR